MPGSPLAGAVHSVATPGSAAAVVGPANGDPLTAGEPGQVTDAATVAAGAAHRHFNFER